MDFGKFIQDVKSRVKNGGQDHFEIIFNFESAIILKNSQPIMAVPWNSVKKIIAGKIDRLTYDPIVICLSDSVDGQHGIAFEEFMDGFHEFLMEINRRYEIDASWFERVNQGAFVANWEILWKCN
jgi:hypothetical protein